MEYNGKLYAKIGNKYLEISHTDEFDKMQEHLMHNEAELIPLREKVQRLQDNILVYQQQLEDLKAKYNECVNNSIC